MNESTVAEELREMRSQLSRIERDQSQRLVALEQHDRETYGNGQPGWKEKLETRVSSLEAKVIYAIGGATALGVALNFALGMLRK